MVDIKVRRVGVHKEMIIEESGVHITTGLFNDKESLETAKELIIAAEDMLPAGYGDQEMELFNIRESL